MALAKRARKVTERYGACASEEAVTAAIAPVKVEKSDERW